MAKSFSIKVGADTSEFLKSLKSADKQINTTKKLGDELNKSLELKFDPTVATQAQKAYQKALTQTEEKAKALKEQLKFLENQGQVDTESYERLQTELAKAEAQATKLQKKLDEVKNAKIEELSGKFEKVGKSIENTGKKLTVLSAAAAGAIAGIAKLAKDAVTTGDDIATLAEQYDMSSKAIQQWQYVALQSDVSSEALYKSAQKVQKALGEQLQGETTSAVKALDKLGISFKDFDSNEEAFAAIIDKLSLVENNLEQAALANDIFGDKMAVNVIPLLRQGAGAISEYLEEFEQVGYLSEETVNKLADLDNEVNKVTAQFNQAKTELGVAMIPVYKILVDILQNQVIPAVQKLTEWFDNLSPAGQKTVLVILAITAVVAPLLILFGKIITTVGILINYIPNFNKVMGVLNTTLGRTAIVAGTFATAIGMIANIISNWSAMGSWQRVISILGTLTTVALGAAIALGAFHSAWSLGAAIAGIVAGIAVVTAAVNKAKNSIDNDIPDYSVPNVTSKSSSSGNYNQYDYANAYDNLRQQEKIITNNYVSKEIVDFNLNIDVNTRGNTLLDMVTSRTIANAVIDLVDEKLGARV